MELVHNRCWFADKQMIKLQEAPENIAEGETPTTVTLYAFDDLVDVGRPGDRVEVTGIFRAVPIRANPRRRSVNSVRTNEWSSQYIRPYWKIGTNDW